MNGVGAAVPWLERLARFGYASKGIVYLVVGGLAAAGTRGADHHRAFGWIEEKPFGRTLLVILGIGLAGYALWRLVSGFADSENRGSDAKGLVMRGGSIGRGLIYSAFAIEMLRMALQHRGGGSSDAKAQHWTARAIDAPFGRWLVAAAALGIVIYGAYQLYAGFKGKLSRKLRLGSLNASVRQRVITISRIGIAARGVVFIVIAGSLLTAALRGNPDEARGTSGALRQVASVSEPLMIGIGVGLAAYGVYALLNARYRRLQ